MKPRLCYSRPTQYLKKACSQRADTIHPAPRLQRRSQGAAEVTGQGTFKLQRVGGLASAIPFAAVSVPKIAHRAAEPRPEHEPPGIEIVEVRADHGE